MEAFLSELSPIGIPLALIAGVLIAVLKPKKHPIRFERPRVEASVAILVVGVVSVLVVVLFYMFRGQGSPAEEGPHVWGPGDVVNQLIPYVLVGWPILVALLVRRQGPSSVGLRGDNLGKAVLVGVVPGLLVLGLLLIQPFFADAVVVPVVPILSASSLYALQAMLVIAFGEEVIFRGYLQTRLIAALGPWLGWGIASVWMALTHFPPYLWAQGRSAPDALLGSLAAILCSSIAGWLMHRCQNLAAPVGFHLFVNWLQIVLWGQ